jgi:hypothetical protein
MRKDMSVLEWFCEWDESLAHSNPIDLVENRISSGEPLVKRGAPIRSTIYGTAWCGLRDD